MKKVILSAAVAMSIFAVSCGSSDADTAETASQQEVAAAEGKEYSADIATSVIKFRATHKGGLAPRYGTVNLVNGTLTVEGGQLKAGNFVVDINSILVDSNSVTEPGKKSIDLTNHLKSPDFFDGAKYPTAKFEITGVAPFDAAKDQSILQGATNMVSGNLSIKDSIVNITFPAIINITDAGVDVQAKFTVDRTSWNLRFGAEGDPADWGISKDFELELNIKAVQK